MAASGTVSRKSARAPPPLASVQYSKQLQMLSFTPHDSELQEDQGHRERTDVLLGSRSTAVAAARSPFHAPHARLAVLNAAARRRASRRHRRGRRRQVARKLVPKTYISIQSVHVPAQPRSGLRTVLLRVLITAPRARRSGRISELPGQLIARYRFVVLRAMRCLLDPQ